MGVAYGGSLPLVASRKARKGQRRTDLSLQAGPSRACPVDQNPGTRPCLAAEDLGVLEYGKMDVGACQQLLMRPALRDTVSSLVGDTKTNTLSSLNSEDEDLKGTFR